MNQILNYLKKFEHFGAIADPAKRKQIAQSIYNQLAKNAVKGIGFTNSTTENFASAIDAILDNDEMKELTRQDPELAQKVTQEILDFINSAKKEINTSENPFEQEQELFQFFSQANKESFYEKWNATNAFLKENYRMKEIDCGFYSEEFKLSLKHVKDQKVKRSFESVKEHLTEKWQQLLFKKVSAWELEIIDKRRKKFIEELYKRIEELKKLQQLLEPFTTELGRLFDMSKGNWQRANFDMLKRYAEFLKQDKELQKLAEMLGKMRQAEKEFEEELFSNTIIKPEWNADYASKSDLVGIIESDDLSSLLPSEMALLSDSTLELVFVKKFAEKKLQTFEYEARVLSFEKEKFQDKRKKEKDGKGPFIICVDTSGSMHGTPETVAKTLCFAILKIAIRENRKCFLISFSTGIETLNLTDLNNSLEKIIEFLSMSFHGGTDVGPAMHEALQQLESNDYKKADVLMISDFVMPAFDIATQELINKAKSNQNKFHSLVIGTSQNKNAIADFDNNWFYNRDKEESIISLVRNLQQF